MYKNNGNIQNAINIITYVGKFWKVEYTRLQAITICVKTVRETQALNISCFWDKKFTSESEIIHYWQLEFFSLYNIQVY